MSRSLVRACLLLPLALFAACGDDDPVDTPTSPTTPTTITDVVEGAISRNGASTSAFVANTGRIQATLTTLSPDNAIIGLALGEWNATTGICQLKITSDNATLGKVLDAAAQVTSNYCLRVYDASGTLNGSVSYKVEIVHF